MPVSASAPLVVAIDHLKLVDSTSAMRLSRPTRSRPVGHAPTRWTTRVTRGRRKKRRPASLRPLWPISLSSHRSPGMSDRILGEPGFGGPSWLDNGEVVGAENRSFLVHLIVLLARKVALLGPPGVTAKRATGRPRLLPRSLFQGHPGGTRALTTWDRKTRVGGLLSNRLSGLGSLNRPALWRSTDASRVLARVNGNKRSKPASPLQCCGPY